MEILAEGALPCEKGSRLGSGEEISACFNIGNSEAVATD
jgi:hypothetical protein